MNIIEFAEIEKSYEPGQQVIKNLSLSVKKGELLTLLGPSGCGKTTLLKMVNRLIPFDSGDIIVRGRSIKEWNPIQLRRSIGYVIQQIGLFPHLTIEKNITYVLSLLKVDRKKRRDRAAELLELVGLSADMLNRYPSQLSGGQNQRVGVARALASDPDIILMDEPFGAVDEIARSGLQDQLKEIHSRVGKTILFVTHDIQEALKLGTRIMLMNNGCIEQIGSADELIYDPSSDFVKEFFGIKGFKAALDDDIMGNLYGKVLTSCSTVDDIYRAIESL